MTQASNTGSINSLDSSGATPSVVAAVFDVDRTLVPVTTTERIFIRYLLRYGNLRMNALLRTALLVLKSLPARVSPFEAIRRERAYLAGQPYEKMRKMAHDCFETGIKPRISRAGLEAIKEHKAKGEMVVLLSGSLDFLLEPFKEYVGADHLIAAKMEVVRGRLTGRIVGDWPYGSYKAVLIRHFAEEHGLDFTRSYAYADHHTDHEVLRLFGNPVVINARTKMQEIARREGWSMKDFS
ncbi:MAG TPA: HAD-IB family hydrolase [Chloroflexia bacterium]|nr:HAD-IB family hydrolase [Chloroflexia bacterium]